MKKITIKKSILNSNDSMALSNKNLFQKYNIKVFNIMGSPGSGKTSFIYNVSKTLKNKCISVIQGDLASSIDTDFLNSKNIPTVQINTGGNCHLDAFMIKKSLENIDLSSVDILFIENVGNLVCPANFKLGEDVNIVLSSIPEGSDKPYKYPGMFIASSVVVLTKIDLINVFKFQTKYFKEGVRMLNKNIKIFETSNKKINTYNKVARYISSV